uniref:Uncharacterized protein n=1 Tax=Arundo donax TaxID=35708 RepID=A0A0A9FI73_ARUDO
MRIKCWSMADFLAVIARTLSTYVT